MQTKRMPWCISTQIKRSAGICNVSSKFDMIFYLHFIYIISSLIQMPNGNYVCNILACALFSAFLYLYYYYYYYGTFCN